MSDRPTPETNSIIRNAQAADHPPTRLAATLTVKCEKLERERDEARELLASEKITRNHIIKRSVEVERERDEAIRKLNNLDVTAIHSCHNECQRPVCVLRRERDEAREKLSARWQSMRDSQDEVLRLTFENRKLRNLINE